MLLTNYLFTNQIYMYNQGLTLNNIQRLIFHKTQPCTPPALLIQPKLGRNPILFHQRDQIFI